MPIHDTDLRSDAELLASFLERREQAAFEVVVRRHERLVLNVCARVLGDRQEAHDAAQAVFLILARKLGDLDLGRPLGPWLHRVARGTAVNAVKAREARREREREAAMRDVSTSDDGLRERLDAELDRLPERYRRPLVLFHMEGLSIEETAAELGSSPGTVGSWLSRGREILRTRLAIPAGMLAALWTAESAPAGFAAWTARGTLDGGCVSAHVLALTKGTLTMMFWTKVKVAALGWVAAAAVAAVGVGAMTPAPKEVESTSYVTASLPMDVEETLTDALQAEPTRVSELVAWWPLDEKADPLKVVGEVGKAEGKVKGCFTFDGKGGYLEAPNSPALDKVQNGNYTLAAWFKPAAKPAGANDEVNDAAFGIVIKTGWHTGLSYTREGKFIMTHWVTKDGEPEWKGAGTWSETYEPGQWYHVAGVVDKGVGTVAILVNGELVHSEELGANREARPTDSTWKVGIASPGAEQWAWPARGAIDDVRIYQRALSPMEVKALFEAK
ncbi:MAG TPA: sigma-70 family RNA polymerase sigma factor [Planctomycetota bacterium]